LRQASFYDAEHFFDGLHANSEYALDTIRAAVEAGAERIILCDTNGGTHRAGSRSRRHGAFDLPESDPWNSYSQ
jgi:isopropylmalate/homocitrate/citramalate synthase